MVNAVQATTILEVGCGSGMHSEFIAKNYLRKGALLVSCDVSTSMVQQMSERYLSSEFKLYPKCTVEIDPTTDFVLNQELTVTPSMPADQESRKVFGCLADNMRLPFPNSFFDCYISNLSLMIVPDYRLQISECFRVLKPNSKACFSVWGRPERTIQFTIMKEVNKRLGRQIVPYNAAHDNFHLSRDIEVVKEEFRKAGFNKQIKAWYQAANWLYEDGKDFVQRFIINQPGGNLDEE